MNLKKCILIFVFVIALVCFVSTISAASANNVNNTSPKIDQSAPITISNVSTIDVKQPNSPSYDMQLGCKTKDGRILSPKVIFPILKYIFNIKKEQN